MAMTERREGQPQPVDLSEDFIMMDESEFFDRIAAVGEQPIELTLPIGLLGNNYYINRLSTLLRLPNRLQRPKVKLVATQGEYETYEERFKEKFGLLDWEITK